MPGAISQGMMMGPSGWLTAVHAALPAAAVGYGWGQQYGYQGMPHGSQRDGCTTAWKWLRRLEPGCVRQQVATATEAEAASQRIRAEQTFLVSQQAQLRAAGPLEGPRAALVVA